MSDTPPPVQIEKARKSFFQRASLVWLIPIIALAVSLGVAWRSYQDRGVVIEIEFANGTGLSKRDTELRYRDVGIGVVEDIKFTDDLGAVVAAVRVDKDVAPFIDASASFWIVKPKLTPQGVTGLDTVLSGVYIEGFWDGDIGPPQTSFKGLEDPPLFNHGQEGIEIALRTAAGGSLADESPITYRGIEVGRVGRARISQEGDFAIAEAIIYHPHSRLISPTTRFWDTSGFTFSVGPQGAEIDFSSFATLLGGGITFDTFVSGGKPVTDGTVFEVFADETSARNSLFIASEVETLEMRVVFNDNISGLAVGAPVELSGFRIGKVQSINGVINADEFGDERVRLNAVLSLQPARLGLPGEVSPEAALDFLSAQIARGLRARLASANLLTGGLKIELVEVPDAPEIIINTGEDIIPIIPTTDSEISDAAASVEGVITRINNLPIEELLNSAINFLDSAEAFVSSEDLRETPADLRALLGDVRNVVASEDLQSVPGKLNSAITRFEGLMAELQKEEFVTRLVAAVDAAASAAEGVETSVEGFPELVTQIDAVAAKVEALPVEQLISELTDLLDAAEKVVDTDAARGLPANVNAALSQVEQALAELRAAGTAENVNTTLASARKAVDSLVSAAGTVESSFETVPALIEKIDAVAAKAADLPLEELSQELTDLLAAAEKVLDTDAARKLPADLGTALNEIEATLAELRAGGTVENLNATLGSARTAADAVSDAADDLPALVTRMRRVLDQASATIAGYDRGETLSRDAQAALRDISKAADAFASLARMLERNPSAFIRGR